MKILSCLIASAVVAVPAVSSAQPSSLGSSSILKPHEHPQNPETPAVDGLEKTQEGKEIFSATHFMVGNRAKELTLVKDIKQSPSFDEEANTRLSIETMNAFQQEDPEYFAKYAEEMTSGNPVRVERALSRGQGDISEYINATYPEIAANGEMTPQACSIGVGGCVWTVILAWNYGAAVNVGGAINVYTALWGPDKTWSPFAEENTTLQRQTMIATLARELATA